jgi:hypothetical protein
MAGGRGGGGEAGCPASARPPSSGPGRGARSNCSSVRQASTMGRSRLCPVPCGGHDQLALLGEPVLLLQRGRASRRQASGARLQRAVAPLGGDAWPLGAATLARLSPAPQPRRPPPLRSSDQAAPPTMVLMASLTSSGIHPWLSSVKRMSTLVLTLFTFWPPAPPDRAKLNSTSSEAGTRSHSPQLKGAPRQGRCGL